MSLDGKEKRLLVRGDTVGIYASGFLLYLREGALIAQPFDPAQGQQKGPSHSVVEQVATGGAMGMFDASENGILIYLTGSVASTKRLTWFDRAGKTWAPWVSLQTISTCGSRRTGMLAANAGYPAGSPNSEIWVEELARAVRMRLTIDPDTDHGIPVWSPDGRKITFGALQGKARVGIYQKPSNGGSDEELILASENSNVQIWPTSWSRDGKFILFTQGNVSLAQADIWVLVLGGKQMPRLFLKAPAPASDGQFAPDGRWVAYTSRESGRDEVYVVPFDAAKVLNPVSGAASASGGKWQVSASGGRIPRWRKDGKEIFYLSPSNQLIGR